MTYQAIFKHKLPNGKFEILENMIETCTEESLTYPGDGAGNYVVLFTRRKKDKFYVYCCESNDERLKKVPQLKTSVLWNNGVEGCFYTHPKKYTLGKKCAYSTGRSFTFTGILEISNVYDLEQKYKPCGFGQASCLI